MNFANCLWDKFGAVDRHNAEIRKEGEDFVSLLKDVISKEDHYSKDLERLAGNHFFT